MSEGPFVKVEIRGTRDEHKRGIAKAMVEQGGWSMDEAQMCVDLADHAVAEALDTFSRIIAQSDDLKLLLQVNLLGAQILEHRAVGIRKKTEAVVDGIDKDQQRSHEAFAAMMDRLTKEHG